MKRPEAAILLMKQVLRPGIHSDYVLMDFWFTTEPMLKALLGIGLDAIEMLKQ